MDTKSIDVGAEILAGKSHGRTDNLNHIRELEEKIEHHKEMSLAAFAKVQLSMGNNFASKSWPVAHLKERVTQLSEHLEALEHLESQVLVAMSPVVHTTGLGTGVTPAEIEGARIRSEQTAADSNG